MWLGFVFSQWQLQWIHWQQPSRGCFVFHLNEVKKEERQAIFNYFSLGGNFASALVAFLAGLNPQPLSLAFLFFYVVIYSIGRLLLPFPTPKSICLIAKLIWVHVYIWFSSCHFCHFLLINNRNFLIHLSLSFQGAPFIFLTSINANGNRQMSFLTKKVILLKKLLGLMKREQHWCSRNFIVVQEKLC